MAPLTPFGNYSNPEIVELKRDGASWANAERHAYERHAYERHAREMHAMRAGCMTAINIYQRVISAEISTGKRLGL
jgi:hypothetical protein